MNSIISNRLKKLEDKVGIKPKILLIQLASESLENAVERFNKKSENSVCRKLIVQEVKSWVNGINEKTGARLFWGNGLTFANLILNRKCELNGEPKKFEIFTN